MHSHNATQFYWYAFSYHYLLGGRSSKGPNDINGMKQLLVEVGKIHESDYNSLETGVACQ